jgi:hypothetical protein
MMETELSNNNAYKMMTVNVSPLHTVSTNLYCPSGVRAYDTFLYFFSMIPKSLSDLFGTASPTTPTPCFIPQGKSPWYPLDRRLGEPPSQSECDGEEKIPSPYWDSNP